MILSYIIIIMQIVIGQTIIENFMNSNLIDFFFFGFQINLYLLY